MTFLVVETAQAVRDSLCYILLSFGIQGLPAASRAAALSILREGARPDGAIVDVDDLEAEGVELIRELKAGEDTRSMRMIVHTVQSHRDFVVRMMELGVLGYLLKPFREEETLTRLRKILERTDMQAEFRRHVRVRPDPEELLRLHFKAPGHPGLISGKILNISMGGTAIEMFNPPPAPALRPGQRLPAVEFTLGGRRFSAPAQVVLIRNRFLSLRFDGLQPAERNTLARYIFKRISH